MERFHLVPVTALRVEMIAGLFCAALLLSPRNARSADPAFRTDGGGNEKLPWLQLKPGEFPPEGSSHAFAGELIAYDAINRTGMLRPDRTDAQRRGDWDIAVPFTLLPYGSLAFHGAPAELRDIPLGTHLHGQFYLDAKPEKNGAGPFTRALRLEDDFTYFASAHRAWRVDAVDAEKGTLTVTGVGEAGSPPDAKPTTFQVNATTRVWKGRCIGALADISAGQSVLLNLTVCTLKGPGRCIDVWIDPESREAAAAHELEIHRQFMREHGLPGWVDEIDNEQGIVTVTLFAGFDPKLGEELAPKSGITAVVAEENLRTYDQINDRIGGEILEVRHVSAGPGNSGVRIRFKPSTLLEGFRPKRVVRLFAGKWKVDDLPREERLYQ